MPLGIEVDAYLHDGQPVEGEARGIVLEIYLLQGRFGTPVQFQLDDI